CITTQAEEMGASWTTQLPPLEKTNCCHPEQSAPLPLHNDVGKRLELSWSENVPLLESTSDVTLMTLSNDPSAAEMEPDTFAAKSSPKPTLNGYGGPVMQGICCHAMLGYDASKHPLLGGGVAEMSVRQGTQRPSEHTSPDGQAWPHALLPPVPLPFPP